MVWCWNVGSCRLLAVLAVRNGGAVGFVGDWRSAPVLHIDNARGELVVRVVLKKEGARSLGLHRQLFHGGAWNSKN
jgi:hypothetical protein